jgi:hypothetical protein
VLEADQSYLSENPLGNAAENALIAPLTSLRRMSAIGDRRLSIMLGFGWF